MLPNAFGVGWVLQVLQVVERCLQIIFRSICHFFLTIDSLPNRPDASSSLDRWTLLLDHLPTHMLLLPPSIDSTPNLPGAPGAPDHLNLYFD